MWLFAHLFGPQRGASELCMACVCVFFFGNVSTTQLACWASKGRHAIATTTVLCCERHAFMMRRTEKWPLDNCYCLDTHSAGDVQRSRAAIYTCQRTSLQNCRLDSVAAAGVASELHCYYCVCVVLIDNSMHCLCFVSSHQFINRNWCVSVLSASISMFVSFSMMTPRDVNHS